MYIYICIKKRTTLALSSTEAECMAMYEASEIIMWLRQFLNEQGYPPTTPTILYEDKNLPSKLFKTAMTKVELNMCVSDVILSGT